MIDIEKTLATFGYHPDTLKSGSIKKILVECYYCKSIFTTNYANIKRHNSIVKKHSCFSCVNKKIVEANILKYGTKSWMESHKTYSCSEDFFETIDSEEKAYWLGFIAADGCVSGNRLKLGLSSKDRDHLVKLLNSLNSSHLIHDDFTKNKTLLYPRSSINIQSKKIVSDLIQYGINERKSLSLILSVELINPELHRHIWRGILDGDGCITQSKNRWNISLLGSYQVISEFIKFLKLYHATEKIPQPRGNIFTVRYGAAKDIAIISNILYDNISIYLDRKYKKAQQIINDIKCNGQTTINS